MSPVVAGTRRGAALPIAAAAVLFLVVVEVLDASGRPGPGGRWLSLILGLVAIVAVLAALRGVARDRQASRSLLTELRAEGVEVNAKAEESEFGKFSWVMDPEGNRLELWEPPPA